MYRYGGKETIARQLAETEQLLAEARKEIEKLKAEQRPTLPTPHSDGHARLLAATREAYKPRRTRTATHAR